MADDCLFCKILVGQIPSTKVYETDTIYAFRDINPAAPTHILIIPRKHIVSVAEVGMEDREVLADLLLAAQAIADQEGVKANFRLVANNGAGVGQSVFHLHFHLLAGRGFSWPPG
jgi:histidine triad (HIT) family protein